MELRENRSALLELMGRRAIMAKVVGIYLRIIGFLDFVHRAELSDTASPVTEFSSF
jgi:hypothetical protein